MKTKSTKRAFTVSIMCLLLCVAMLIGTTYAWFTDSVTSGNNKIIAGNLDIDVLVDDESIANKENLFQTTNWEPGVISYQNFTVQNKGNLAAKIKFNLDVLDENYTTEDSCKLSQVIKVAYLEDTEFTGDRTAAQELAYSALTDQSSAFSLEASATKKIAVVLYWEPGENDNNWNLNNGKTTNDGQPLYINLAVNAIATQYTSENDSFDNQYDALATYPILAPIINETTEETFTSGENIKTIKDGESTEEADTLEVSGTLTKTIKTTASTADSTTLDISFNYNEAGVDYQVTEFTNARTITETISTGLKEVKVTHSHGGTTTDMILADSAATAAVTDNNYYYDATTGKLTITSKTFSPFTVTYKSDFVAAVGAQGYNTLAAAIAAANTGDTVTLLKDSSEYGLRATDGKSVTLDLGKNSLTNASSSFTINQYGSGTLTIKGNSNSAIKGIVRTYATKVIFDVAFEGKVEQVKIASSGSLSISGGYFKGIKNASDSAVVPTNYLVKGYTYETADGYYHIIPITAENAYASVKIGETTAYYMTLGEALEAAKGGGTVTLLKDKDSSNSDFGFNYYATGDVVLDLNGHTWTLSSPNSSSSPAIRLYSGNLTVKTSVEGGKIYSTWSGCKIFELNGGNLTIDSGDYSGNSSITSIATGYNSGNITINGGTFGKIYCEKQFTSVTISGGTFNGEVKTAYEAGTVVNISGGTFNKQVSCNSSNAGVFNISGGTFNCYLGNGGTFNISGGTFNTYENMASTYGSILSKNSNSAFNVTGGTFGEDISTNNKVTISPGYSLVDNQNGTWTVSENPQ